METGFAHDDRARVAEPGDDRRVLVRHGVKAPVGTRCGRHPGDVDEIFDGHRDTGQGTGRPARRASSTRCAASSAWSVITLRKLFNRRSWTAMCFRNASATSTAVTDLPVMRRAISEADANHRSSIAMVA